MDMVTMDIMARGLQRLSQDMVIMAMDMVLVMVMDMAMVIMDIMARDLLMLSQLLLPSPLLLLMPSLLLLLSQDMDMVMDMALDISATDMVMDMAMDMDMDIMDIMARGLLMLSPAMDIMVMVMAMVMDTTAKHICCSFTEFSTNEVGPCRSSQKTHNFISKKINI